MSTKGNKRINVHLDTGLFTSAIEYTSAQTGFTPNLIEKDYFCSVILEYLSKQSPASLVFKGGTLLAKAHAGFYRLSEDLDFTLPITAAAKRKQRSNLVKPLKSIINDIHNAIPNVTIEKELAGSNESKQYNAELNYTSVLTDKKGKILIEIGLREGLVSEAVSENLLDPFANAPIVGVFNFACLSKEEAYAEKLRAAMTREKLAIRDFYDLYYARLNNIVDFSCPRFIDILKCKLNLPDTQVVVFDDARVSGLEGKIITELYPTLKQDRDDKFNLIEVIDWIDGFKVKYLSAN